MGDGLYTERILTIKYITNKSLLFKKRVTRTGRKKTRVKAVVVDSIWKYWYKHNFQHICIYEDITIKYRYKYSTDENLE